MYLWLGFRYFLPKTILLQWKTLELLELLELGTFTRKHSLSVSAQPFIPDTDFGPSMIFSNQTLPYICKFWK